MSPRTVGRVALAMFRETVRDRVLYALVAFAVLVIGASLLISQLTAGQDVKIIKDLGLAAMSIIGVFIAIFIGIGLVSKEVEKRSVYSLLAKPVRRSELVVGKYVGLVLTLLVNLVVDDGGLVPGALVLRAYRRGARAAVLGSAGARPADAHCRVPDLRSADAGDRDRALLLDVLEPRCCRRCSPSACSSRDTSARDLRNFEEAVASPLAAGAGEGALLRAPEHGGLRREVGGGARAPGRRGDCRGRHRRTAALYVAGLVLASIAVFSRRDFK